MRVEGNRMKEGIKNRVEGMTTEGTNKVQTEGSLLPSRCYPSITEQKKGRRRDRGPYHRPCTVHELFIHTLPTYLLQYFLLLRDRGKVRKEHGVLH